MIRSPVGLFASASASKPSGGAVQEFLAALSCDEQIHVSPIEWLKHEAWQSGRVVLIGDASHASIPMMGQGGCLAMEAAWVLAEVLHSAESVEQALSIYTCRRRPRVDWVRQQSEVAAQSLNLPPAMRNAVLRKQGDRLICARFSPLIPPP